MKNGELKEEKGGGEGVGEGRGVAGGCYQIPTGKIDRYSCVQVKKTGSAQI